MLSLMRRYVPIILNRNLTAFKFTISYIAADEVTVDVRVIFTQDKFLLLYSKQPPKIYNFANIP